jgi:hypothetical protein
MPQGSRKVTKKKKDEASHFSGYEIEPRINFVLPHLVIALNYIEYYDGSSFTFNYYYSKCYCKLLNKPEYKESPPTPPPPTAEIPTQKSRSCLIRGTSRFVNFRIILYALQWQRENDLIFEVS